MYNNNTDIKIVTKFDPLIYFSKLETDINNIKNKS